MASCTGTLCSRLETSIERRVSIPLCSTFGKRVQPFVNKAQVHSGSVNGAWPHCADRHALLHACIQGKEGIRGHFWFTEVELRNGAALRPDKTGKGLLMMLRHLGRLSEVRARGVRSRLVHT